ncbi:MAG: UDP-N-acetylmuramoyl-tripeptide--D-alanyl-D-alanine ligase [Treponema sp.]|jgi:UDP-N-acetylmuramoyl-tripeptide--D-alanyl-D-alanine ligase|nr:UDP-N-acetylmuramoyl-tripeptide--D-alanyl-D-alanine ligase [Treponema sp.]
MNQILMDFDELAGAAGARIFPGSGSGGGEGFSSVGVDSRKIEEGALFVALPGAREDGHRFVEDAFRAGACAAMVAESRVEVLNLCRLAGEWGRVLVVVEDTLRGLQDAAAFYAGKFPRLVRVCVTGSSGKTTTKEIAAAMIRGEKKVVMNSGNLNSETGLPLSVFNIRPEHEVGIFEAGMNRRGEIGELAQVLKPHIALITNIGSAHIGIVGAKASIAEEKKDVFSCFTGTETALVPAGDEYSDFLARGVRGKVLFYGPEEFPEFGEVRDLGLEGAEIDWDGEMVRFGLPGRFNLKNLLAAAAIAREIPVSSASIRRGLGSIKPLFGRGEILAGKTTVIRDCYNSNPESLEAAVDFCDNLTWPGRRLYVIGAMVELGKETEEAHRKIGRILSDSIAERIFLYGAETEAAAAILASMEIPFFYTDSMKELGRTLEDYIRPGDLVLLKGSRSCALEQLTPVLLGARETVGAVGEYCAAAGRG